MNSQVDKIILAPGYEKELDAYHKAVFSKKRKGNLTTEKRYLFTIADLKLALKILKRNRKRLFGA